MESRTQPPATGISRTGQLILGVLVGATVYMAENPASLAEAVIESPAIVNALLLVILVWVFRRRREPT